MTSPGVAAVFRADESGVTATQLAVVMPAVLLLIMLTVQFGLWWHASQLAAAAADTAAFTAALPDGTSEAGHDAALDLLDQAGNLTELEVRVERTGDTVLASVSGVAPHVVPGLRWSVHAQAASAVERLILQGER